MRASAGRAARPTGTALHPRRRKLSALGIFPAASQHRGYEAACPACRAKLDLPLCSRFGGMLWLDNRQGAVPFLSTSLSQPAFLVLPLGPGPARVGLPASVR